jgi:hypothetical protein
MCEDANYLAYLRQVFGIVQTADESQTTEKH